MGFLTSARKARFDGPDGPDRALYAVWNVGDADQGHAHHVSEPARRRARGMSALQDDHAPVREGGRVIRQGMRPREEIEDNNQTDADVGGASHTQQRTLMLEVLLDIRDLLSVAERVREATR